MGAKAEDAGRAEPSLLSEGENCWQAAEARRCAFLIDTEAYFTAVFEAIQRARRSILLLGWGFDPRTRLAPDGADGPADPDEIGRLLIDLSRARPELDIRILVWNSALPVAASQDFFPHRARGWFRNTRIGFHLDSTVPFGACHHQKVLVIDDALAFCGGGDICVDRWDSPAHLDVDLRRIMPRQVCHAPRHEVMAMVDGQAAGALGALARRRWLRATGERIEPAQVRADPWPVHVPPTLRGVRVAVARTEPAWRGQPMVEENRRLVLDQIAAARETLYLENQYFTSPIYAEAVAARLSEPDGPEVLLISSGRSPSWFDQATMDRARSNMLWRLKAADVFGRFAAYHPVTSGGEVIIVHSKVSVVDDRIARVGSTNLNNRSGGFDTECDLAVEVETPEARMAVAAFRDRLVGHFMGVTGDAVAKARAERGGLLAAVEHLNGRGRLRRLEPAPHSAFGEFISAFHVGDPADTADSWRIFRRRERLYARARGLAEEIRTQRVTSDRPA